MVKSTIGPHSDIYVARKESSQAADLLRFSLLRRQASTHMTILALLEASLHYVGMKQPEKKSSVPGCSNWTSLELHLPKCRDDPRMAVWAANRPEECQRLTTSQRDMTVKSNCRNRHNQQECRPGGRVCLPQTPKGRKCERRHTSHPQASILHWEAGLKPLYVR